MTKLAENIDELPNYEEVPAYTERNYDSAPIDETCNEYEQYEKKIGIPDHEIVALDYEYVTTRHTIFSFKKESSYQSERPLKIYDIENRNIFSCKDDNHKVELLYYQNNALFTIRNDPNERNNFKIYDSRDDIEKELATIKMKIQKKSDIYIYKIQFLNKSNGQQEELDIRVNNDDEKFFYEVYCNVGGENETMISKITKKNKAFIIEIAPGVDYTLLIGFCACFFIKMNKRKVAIRNTIDAIGVLSFICCIQ